MPNLSITLFSSSFFSCPYFDLCSLFMVLLPFRLRCSVLLLRRCLTLSLRSYFHFRRLVNLLLLPRRRFLYLILSRLVGSQFLFHLILILPPFSRFLSDLRTPFVHVLQILVHIKIFMVIFHI
jgi:hypothetical protein